MTESAALKYPVVLVHGLIAHDRPSIIKFWGKIPQALRESGAMVFFGNTDSWGDYESNADLLKTTIDNVLSETNSEKVNIIAHSKGGLDSRYFIWKYDYGGKVASLTTVSTPHRGAELADLIYRQKIVHSRFARQALFAFGKIYGDKNPDLFKVNYQLTTEYMQKFNDDVSMDGRVHYQSMYTVMKDSSDDPMFFYCHRYIQKISGDNDGFVSEYSAQWGNYVKIEGGISHAESFDIMMKEKPGLNIPGIYKNIVYGLSEKGF